MVQKKRHIAKALSWRLIATTATGIISWAVSGDPMLGLQIGIADFVLKLLLYYYHERAWYKFSRFGVDK